MSTRDDYPGLAHYEHHSMPLGDEIRRALAEIDRLRVIETAARAYVRSDPPRPEWRTLCEALGVYWNGAT